MEAAKGNGVADVRRNKRRISLELFKIPDISKRFLPSTIEYLGSGAYADVFKAQEIESGHWRALKALNPKDAPTKKLIEKEIKLTKMISHENVVKLFDVLTPDRSPMVVMILEYARGGELYSKVEDHGALGDRECAHYMRDVLTALSFLHSMNVCHRDVKPENILLFFDKDYVTGRSDYPTAKLADLGLSRSYETDAGMSTYCGSVEYCAPELISDNRTKYGPEVDVWALGVVAFTCLTSFLPFGGSQMKVVVRYIKMVVYEWPKDVPVSPDARAFVNSVLVRVAARPSATQALDHRWVERPAAEDDDEEKWAADEEPKEPKKLKKTNKKEWVMRLMGRR